MAHISSSINRTAHCIKTRRTPCVVLVTVQRRKPVAFVAEVELQLKLNWILKTLSALTLAIPNREEISANNP